MNNHYQKIIEMIETGAIPMRDLPYLNIYHDDWCALIGNRGPCDCDPEVENPRAGIVPVTGDSARARANCGRLRNRDEGR